MANVGITRCDTRLRQAITAVLDRFDRLPEQGDGTAAAVALPVIESGYGSGVSGMPTHPEWQAAPALLLTRRSSKLKDHPGQWALPGGRIDEGETPVEAALREMHEEVGLELTEADVLGQLDEFVTRSGFAILPFVVWVGDGHEPVPNPDEVDRVHRIPFTELLRDDAPLLDETEDGDAPVLRMPVGDTWIAAPTAAFLYQFREVCLLDKQTRVAHFDQPRFAWK